MIRELREEVDKLKAQLLKHGIASDKESLQEALDQNEKLMKEASLTWEQKEKQTERIHQVSDQVYFSLYRISVIYLLSAIFDLNPIFFFV